MKKLLIPIIFFISLSNTLFAQNKFGSKDCSNAPTLCNNDVIVDKLIGAKGAKGFNDIPTNFNSCFKPKSEYNPFWYKFTASNSGTFEMYLNAKQEGVDFDFILFDVTAGCNSKIVLSCNQSQLDLDSNNIGTGICTDSMNFYEADFPLEQNSWQPSINLVTGNIYAIYIESRQLGPTDSSFTVTFGGTAQFKNVTAAFTFSPSTCFGKPITFTNTSIGGFNYQWDFGDNKVSNVTNPTHNYENPGTYTVTLKSFSNSGCVDIFTASISVNVAFNPFAGNDVEICSGNFATLNATGGVSYSWSPVTGLSSPTAASTNASPLTPTIYTVTATDASGCTGTDEVQVSVNNLPVVNAGNDVTICEGQSTPLSASGALFYSWSPAAGLSSTTIANPIANPSATTTYTVTATDPKGCKGTSLVTVTVNPKPSIFAGNDVTICNGQNTNLNATGAISYAWSPATRLSDANISNPVADPSSTTTYVVTGTDAKSCTGTDTVKVIVNPLPPVSAGADFAICSGSSAILNASGANNYIWTPATGLSSTSVANPTASPTTTTTYIVTGTDALGCQNSASIKISVNPTPVISAGANVAICAGASTTLTATGGTTYSWNPTAGLSASNIASPIASPTITTLYTVTGSDALGCQGTASVTVNVNPLPLVSAGSSVVICNGQSTNLNASGAQNYTWTPATGLSNSAISNPIANPVITTIYNVTGVDNNGCSNTSSLTVTVNPLPIINAGSNVTICSGNSTNLNATGGVSYSWSPAGGLSATTISNPVASPSTTTLYTVTGTDGNGCQASASVNVIVNPLPIINAGSDVTLCSGASTNLNATGAVNYSWSPTTGLSNPAISNPVANPATSTLYTVTGTDGSGCIGTASVNVNINPLPVVSAGSDATICNGQSTNLLATGAISYNWSPATGLSNLTIANPVATPTTTTTYTVTGIDGNGCQGTANVTVNVNTLPLLSAGSDVAICNGQNTTLVASGATSYSWSPAGGLSSTTISNPVANPSTTTDYTVTGTDGNGCKGTSTVKVTVNDLPVISAGSDVAICNGQSTNLNASGGLTYAWTPTSGLSDPSIANPDATPTSSTTYTVTGTNAQGCSGMASVNVTVNPGPAINAGSNVAICSGQSTNLSASGADTYVWSPFIGLSSTTIANPTANPVATTTYTVIGKDAFGCQGTANVTVTINPLPSISAGSDVSFCKGNSAMLNATGGITYTWSPALGLSSTTISNPIASPLFTTTYTVTGTDAFGCTNSATVTTTVNPLLSADAGSDAEICAGQNTTLNASGGITYNWSPVTGLSSTSIPSPVANPVVTTKYFVTVTDINGCQGTDSVLVSVNALPIISAGTDLAICSGQSTNLLATGGLSYNWTPSAGLSATNIANPTANPPSTTVYTVNGIDAKGCQGSSSVTINVNPLPVISAGSDVSFCRGNSAMLNASGGVSYIWSPTAGLSSNTIANPVASPFSTTTYSVSGTDLFGCTNTASVLVTVNPLSTADAGSDVTICAGQNTTLNATGGDTYIWSPATGLSATNIANPISNAAVTTKYFVTVTDINGCQGTDSVLVSIIPLPIITTSNNVAICNSQSTNLIASGGVAYNWTPGTGLSAANIANPIANPLTTTVYNVIGTDTNGCQNTASVTVTVNPLPIINAGSDISLCLGDNTTLNASGGQSYVWSPATGLSNVSIPNPIATPTATTSYEVTGTDVNGCKATASVTVTVNTLPVVDAGPDVAICFGNAASLNASGAASYSWSPATDLSSTNISNPLASPSATTTYKVNAIDGNGCKGQDSVLVTVNYINVKAFSDTSFCMGGSKQLNAIGGQNYNWTPATGLSDPTISNPVAKPMVTTKYTVDIMDVNGCKNKDSVTITIHALPVASAGSDVAYCEGGIAQLNASGGITYNWSPAIGLSSSSISNPIANPAATTNYTVTVTDVNGCQDSDVIKITVNDLPNINISNDTSFCFGNSAELSASGGTSYQWFPATGLSSTNIANPIADPSTTTTYSVTVTDANNCSSKDSVVVGITYISINVSEDDTICNGSTTQLNATGGVNYQWTPATSLSNNSIQNPIAKPTVTTTYFVTVKDLQGCINQGKVTVRVNDVPAFDAGGDISFCNGKSAVLSATGNGSILWTPSLGLSDPTSLNPVASPSATTKYYGTLTDVNGCQNIDSVMVNINYINITKSKDATICLGSTTQLIAAGGTVYQWSPTTGLDNAQIPTPEASPLVNTTYVVTVTDLNGCKNSDSIQVKVNPTPIAEAGNDVSICNGNSTNLSASGGVSYSWSPVTGLSDPSIANPSATPIISTDYIVTVIGTNGCTDQDTVSVAVTNINISVSNDTSVCKGNSANLNASGGIKYAWTPAANLSDKDIANPIASPTKKTTYRVTVTDINGCKNSDSVVVNVNFITTTISNDTTLCAGSSSRLIATGGNKYSWSPSIGISDPLASNPLASPLLSTKYFVTVTDINGCQNVDSVNVNINKLPIVDARKDTSVCNGNPVTMSATGGIKYAWSPSTGLSDATISNPIATPLVPTKYIVTASDINGCSNIDSAFINVTYILIKTSNDTTICTGEQVPLKSSGGITFKWTPATGLSDPNIANPIAAPNDSVNYEVTITDINGCKNSAVVKVNVHQYPLAFAGNDISICLGKDASLNATGGSIYNWTPSAGLNNAAIANPVASPAVTTQYIAKVSDDIGCTSEDTVTVNVTISVSGSASADPTSFCQGQSVSLKAVPGNGVQVPASPFSFDGGITFQADDQYNIPSIKNDTTAFVIIKDLNGCLSDSIKIPLTKKIIKGNTLEVSAASCSLLPNGIGKFTNASGGTSPYSFAIDGGILGSDSVFNGLVAGNHLITVQDFTGCQNTFSLIIDQLPSILAQILKTDPICSGDVSGAIVVQASGGSGLGFKYSLDNGKYQVNNTFNNLPEGLHTIVIKDSISCFDTLSTIISAPDPVTIDISSSQNVLCYGNKSGRIILSASGGTPNYVYSLGSALFQPSPNFTNLGKGAFTAVVKDANGCKDSTTVFLLEPDTISAKVTITQVPLCNGILGEIQLSSIAGGTPGYLKGIDGKAPGASNTFANLLPGNHVVKIVDKNSCTRSYDVILPGDPNSISAKISIDSIICNNGNGTINLIDLTGGNRPFQFSLNDQLNFQPDSSFDNLKKGLYTIFAKNADACLSQFVVNLIEPLPIQTALISQSDISCHGLTDGAISIQGIGGNNGYTYSLSNGLFGSSGVFTDLGTGKDTITIKDSKACQNIYPFEIHQPDSIIVQITELDSAHCSIADGRAKITSLTGGTGSFKYSLNGGLTYQTDSTFRFLKSGSYDLLLKDAAACEGKATFIIDQKGGGLKIALVKKDITDLSCNNANIGAIALSNFIGGKIPYLFSIDNTSATKADSTFDGLGAGAHAVHISDAAGCNYEINFTVNQPQPINFQLDIFKTESCNNSNGIIKVSGVTGGDNTYLYSIDNKEFQEASTFEGVSSGLHNIEVKDGSTGSCKTSKPITMSKKAVPNAVISIANPLCFGYSTGQMKIDTVIGGEAPYTFSLDSLHFQTETLFQNLKADTFSLQIKDSECPNFFTDFEIKYIYNPEGTKKDSIYVPYFVLTQPDSITAETFTIEADRSSAGGIFGFYKLEGGNGPYFYSLDSINFLPVVSDTTVIQNLTSGDYFVYIKDSRDCPQQIKIYLGKSLFIPNLVTPNGDGQNDYFEISALKNNSKLMIFNRWGTRVYLSDDYDNSWNGEGLPDGVYYFDLIINNGKKIKGWVQIVR